MLSAFVVFFRRKEPKIVDPANPPAALWIARKLRNSKKAVAAYRWAAQTGFPTLFILIVAWLAVSGLNVGLYNLRSTVGAFCEADEVDKNKTEEARKKEAQQQAMNDKLGSATVDISSPLFALACGSSPGGNTASRLSLGSPRLRQGHSRKSLNMPGSTKARLPTSSALALTAALISQR